MVIFCSACSSTAERACQRLTNGESAFCWEQSLQVSQVGTSPGPGNYTCTSLTIITLSYERLHSLKLSLDCPVWHKCTVWRPVTWFLICWRLWLIQVTWRRLAVHQGQYAATPNLWCHFLSNKWNWLLGIFLLLYLRETPRKTIKKIAFYFPHIISVQAFSVLVFHTFVFCVYL